MFHGKQGHGRHIPAWRLFVYAPYARIRCQVNVMEKRTEELTLAKLKGIVKAESGMLVLQSSYSPFPLRICDYSIKDEERRCGILLYHDEPALFRSDTRI
jgi:hypothetical protein